MEKIFIISACVLSSALLCAHCPLPLHLAATSAELTPSVSRALSAACVIDTRRITIPGYPKAFNPSLVPYKEGYLLSFRVKKKMPPSHATKELRRDASFIGLALLDSEFRLCSKTVQLLDITSYSSQLSCTAEDARLLKVDDRVLIFFNDISRTQVSGSYALYLGELLEKKGLFTLKEPAKFLDYDQSLYIEKNWSPFCSNGKLYVIYSDQPRIVLEVNEKTGQCTEISTSDEKMRWEWGHIRGGTPAYLEGDTFLTFFHSSIPAPATHTKGKQGLNYVMGAYTFEKTPPFAIRSITPVPQGQLGDYLQDNARKLIFPAGIVIRENKIYVTWGKDDRQIYVTCFDKDKLIGSMVTPDSAKKSF